MTKPLLSRLQALTGPDRGVDAEIALSLFPWLRDCARDDRDDGPGWTTGSGGRAYAPRYTESLDDAVTTISEDHYWVIGSGRLTSGGPRYGAQILLSEGEGFDVIGEGESDANAAIALLIAREIAVYGTGDPGYVETDPHVLGDLARVHGFEPSEEKEVNQ